MALTLGLRPRLEFMVDGTAPEVIRGLDDRRSDYEVTVVNNYVVVALPEAQADAAVEALKAAGVQHACRIGQVEALADSGGPHLIFC